MRMVAMSGMDIDRLERMTPSKLMEEMADHWPGVYEALYAKGFRTQTALIAELRRQSHGGRAKASCRATTKRRIGVEAAAQNDS